MSATPHTMTAPTMSENTADPTTSPPVLMIGAARSGTTVLRLMLGHHPKLNCFGELEYAMHGVRDGKFPTAQAYRDDVVNDRIYRHQQFPLDPELSHRDLVRSFLDSAKMLEPDKPIVGATIHHHLDLLPDLWPEARFIQVIRDPRDVARSTLRLGWNGHCYFGTDIWLDAQHQLKKFVEKVDPDQYITVRYEDLIRNTEHELRRCCDHIGVEFDQAMLEYDQATSYKKPDVNLIDQWKRKLSKREIQLLEGSVGDLLTDTGYEPSGHGPAIPGPLELAKLKLADRFNRVRFHQRRYGTSLWLQRAIARRVGPASWRNRVNQRAHAVHDNQLQ